MLSFPPCQKFKPSHAFCKHCFFQRFSRLKYSSSKKASFLPWCGLVYLLLGFFSIQWQPGNSGQGWNLWSRRMGCVCVLGPLKDIDSVLKTETLHNILPCSTIAVIRALSIFPGMNLHSLCSPRKVTFEIIRAAKNQACRRAPPTDYLLRLLHPGLGWFCLSRTSLLLAHLLAL